MFSFLFREVSHTLELVPGVLLLKVQMWWVPEDHALLWHHVLLWDQNLGSKCREAIQEDHQDLFWDLVIQ